MNDVLRFCPKCGGQPIIVHEDDDTYQVKCWWDLSCGNHTAHNPTEEQAIEEWNYNNPMPNSL